MRINLMIHYIIWLLLCLWIRLSIVSGECASHFNWTASYEDSCVDCLLDNCSWTVMGCQEGPCDPNVEYPYGCSYTSCRYYDEDYGRPGHCRPSAMNDVYDMCDDESWCNKLNTCKDCLNWTQCFRLYGSDEEYCECFWVERNGMQSCSHYCDTKSETESFCVSRQDTNDTSENVCSTIFHMERDCHIFDDCTSCLSAPGCLWRMTPDPNPQHNCNVNQCSSACDCPGGRCIGLEDEDTDTGPEKICETSTFDSILRDYDKCGTADNCKDCFGIDDLEYFDRCKWFAAEYDYYEYCAPRCIRDCGSDPGPYDTCERVGRPFNGYIIMEDGDEIYSGCDCSESWLFLNYDFYVKQRSNGDLVIRRGVPGNNSRIVWSSGVNLPQGEYWTRLQRDGNLITREGVDKSGRTVWKTKTSTEPNEHYFLGVTTDMKSVELWKGTRHKMEKLLKSFRTKHDSY